MDEPESCAQCPFSSVVNDVKSQFRGLGKY